MTQLVIMLLLVSIVVVLVFILLRLHRDVRQLRIRLAPITDLDAEAATLKAQAARAKQELDELVATQERQRSQLTEDYGRARKTYDALKSEIALLEENLEDISFGFYKPHFTFQTSEEYKARLEALRDEERQLIRDGAAAVCPVQWSVGGSASEGARMARQNVKLVLRAFNGECDAALAKVAWNNVTKMEERIRKSCDAIERLGTVLQVSITPKFLNLKLDELRLTYEHEEKQHQEQEEQRGIRQQIREEERAQRELEKAREEAERDEATFQKALEKAKAEVGRATGERVEELSEQIKTLESQLEEAHRQKERALSRAQQTKSGHVYVISNVGSFGEDIYKVGMTRRLEPMERIDELGDASVPFPFDVHAIIYSENAPELEGALHDVLSARRINLVNPRKEFFRVSFDELERFAKNRGLDIRLTKLAEAKQYRETLSIRQQQLTLPVPPPSEKFPPVLFGGSPAQESSTSVGE